MRRMVKAYHSSRGLQVQPTPIPRIAAGSGTVKAAAGLVVTQFEIDPWQVAEKRLDHVILSAAKNLSLTESLETERFFIFSPIRTTTKLSFSSTC
jgi:hypothetical protein